MTEAAEAAPTTRKVAVWDVPTRLFHWVLAGLFLFSWWSAENHRLELHVWSGIGILTLLLFRLLWGLFGSSTARFANFVRGPKTVLAYVRDPGSWRIAGHTPLGALSIIAMLVALTVQVGLGLIATDEDGIVMGPLAGLVSISASDAARELHDLNFKILLGLVGLHVAAILYYRFVEGKRLIKPMLDGRAKIEPGIEPLRKAKWWVALLCLAAALAVARWIVAGAPPFGP
ncbi:MAG TPA: cytochrome b/b6 domain-containing protein [Sphingomicrobium sp.]